MRHLVPWLLVALSVTGCADLQRLVGPSHDYCYTESGWLDATNGCSVRDGYPDCYLVCPGHGTRERI